MVVLFAVREYKCYFEEILDLRIIMEKKWDANEAELLQMQPEIDSNSNIKVVTLKDLQKRRQELLLKRQNILNKPLSRNLSTILGSSQPKFPASPICVSSDIDYDIANCDTLTTIFQPIYPSISATVSPDVAEETVGCSNDPVITYTDVTEETVMDFSPDNSIADPDFVPLSDITNVEPMVSDDFDSFPEQNLEGDAAKESRKRKQKADRKTWRRELNKKDRMLGKAYVGFRKVNNKYIQEGSKPQRAMGPKCSSSFCARSKVLFCSNLTEDIRQQIFERFWSMTWKEKKMYVRSMVDTENIKRKTTESKSRRSETRLYYLQIHGKKERVCLKTFLATLAIKE
ncbi:unnamed protein product, partial [Brenthis ino]